MTEQELKDLIAWSPLWKHHEPPKMDTIGLDHFEIALGGGAVHLHAGGKVIRLSFSDVENMAFQIQVWKQLNGYPEASPQFP